MLADAYLRSGKVRDLYARDDGRLVLVASDRISAFDVILPTERLSVYDFALTPPDLVPTESDTERFIREVERRYPDPRVLDAEIARWWET